MLRNQSEMYMDIMDDPDVVLEAATNIKDTLKDYCTAIMETGVNGIMFDTLFSSGSIMRKEMWEEMEGELVQDLAEHVHSLFRWHDSCYRKYFDIFSFHLTNNQL